MTLDLTYWRENISFLGDI